MVVTSARNATRRAARFAILGLFVAALLAFLVFDGSRYVNLDTIKANRSALLAWTEAHYALALLIAFLVFVTATALSLPVGAILSLTTGFLFGRWVGTVLVLLAATTGATLLFLAARYLVADIARRRLGTIGERIIAGFSENAFNYLLFLRLVPLFPFFLVNLAPAFTDIKVRTYVLATLIGMVPGTFAYVNLGQALGRIESTRNLLSLELIGGLTLLGCLVLLPVLVKHRKTRT